MIKSYKIKPKIINTLTKDGSKEKSEKIFKKTIKSIQKTSKKESKHLVKLSIGMSTPAFKIHCIKLKKRKKRSTKVIPSFIYRKNRRLSLAIRLILQSVKKKINFHEELKTELLKTIRNNGNSIDRKIDLQRQALVNKTMLKFYRWH